MSARNTHAAKAARREARAEPKDYSQPTTPTSNRSELRDWMKKQRREKAKEQHAQYRTVHLGRITTNIKIEDEDED